MKITIHGDQGERADIAIPPSPYVESLYALSPHKCGSVLLQNIMGDLAQAAGYPFLNIYSQIFTQGVPHKSFRPSIDLLLRLPGYCFAGLRQPWTGDTAHLAHHRKIFLVRDPRDVMVSYYFSMAKSHALPGSGPLRDSFLSDRQKINQMSISEFINAGTGFFVLENMREFLRWSREMPRSKVFRYEDVIFHKQAWVRDICTFFELKVPAATMDEIAARHDIVPDTENPDAHVRQVRPGNYKTHLSHDDIARIEHRFQDLFEAFGY